MVSREDIHKPVPKMTPVTRTRPRVHTATHTCIYVASKRAIDKSVRLKTFRNFSVTIMKLTQKIEPPILCWLVFSVRDDRVVGCGFQEVRPLVPGPFLTPAWNKN